MITALMRVKIGGYFFSEARFDKYEIKDSSLLFTNIRFGGDEMHGFCVGSLMIRLVVYLENRKCVWLSLYRVSAE